jgi:hypothetical protein
MYRQEQPPIQLTHGRHFKGSCSWHPNSTLRAGFASVNFRVAIILRGAEGLAISAFIQATELILLPEIHLVFIVPRLLSDDQNFELAILSSGQEQLVSHADVQTTMNVYTQAVSDQKRLAHGRIVRLLGKQARNNL